MVVDGNKAPFIGLQTDRFKIKIFSVWSATYGDNQFVAFEYMFGTLVISIGNADAALCQFGLADLDTELDVQSLL